MNALKNKVQLIGRLGFDPELKTVGSDKTLARFSLATSESYKDKSGQWQNETYWHNITAWGQLANVISKVASKGDEIAVEGKIVNKSYQDKQGITRYSTEIIINEFMMMGNKKKPSAEIKRASDL